MTTIWTSTPAVSVASINELRTAVDAAVEAAEDPPVVWTDGSPLPSTMSVKAKYVIELRDAIQALWNKDDRKLGLIPNWTTGVVPGLPAPTQPSILIRETDVTDLRRWFNHYETWGDLRGVHWWKPNSSPAFPGIFWNVESVIALTTEPDANNNTSYNVNHVNEIRGYCEAARNHGLVNIVRLDWKKGQAVPTVEEGYDTWTERFTSAVNTLKGVATLFIVGNEPNEEGGISGSQYAEAFSELYQSKVADTKYLAAGPTLFKVLGDRNTGESDLDWLENASREINYLDGWALHTYGAPYLDYAGATDDANALCDTPSVNCPIDRDEHKTSMKLTEDAGFRRYRNLIDRLRGKSITKPVYITETNTSGYKAEFYNVDREDTSKKAPPSVTYVTGWIQKTYQEIWSYNRERSSNPTGSPPILCLCWFVDSDRDSNWMNFALSNNGPEELRQARADFIASTTSTGIDPNDPGSYLAPWTPIVGTRVLSGTVS